MDKKYVFLDVDGTLVNFQSKIPDSAITALKQAQANGHRMIIATGRQRSQIYPQLLDAVSFDGILACCGAYLEYNGREIYESVCSDEKLSEIIDFFHEHDISYCLQTKGHLYAEARDLERIRQFMIDRGNPDVLIESVLGDVCVTDTPKLVRGVEKLAYYNSPFGIEETKRILGDYFEVVSYSLGRAPENKKETFHGEINFDGVSKATGIENFMRIVGAPLDSVIAVGDSGNDLEMIKFAKIGVCMGNGAEAVKEIADYVTTDIDNDGIYNAFKALGLI